MPVGGFLARVPTGGRQAATLVVEGLNRPALAAHHRLMV